MTYELGKIAYLAYCESTGGKSAITDAPLPAYEDQAQSIKDAWQAAAEAVWDHVLGMATGT